jgi:hypothetical protein
MPAAKLNLTVEQGATFSKRLVWKDKNRRPINITGWTARMQIRKIVADPNLILELSTANGRIVFTAAGTIELRLTAQETSTLQAGVYDLEMVAPDGSVTRLVEGKVVVSPEVTR